MTLRRLCDAALRLSVRYQRDRPRAREWSATRIFRMTLNPDSGFDVIRI